MDRPAYPVKDTPYKSVRKQDETKTRLLERIHRLYDDGRNGSAGLERWQQEEVDILITKWRSIS